MGLYIIYSWILSFKWGWGVGQGRDLIGIYSHRKNYVFVLSASILFLYSLLFSYPSFSFSLLLFTCISQISVLFLTTLLSLPHPNLEILSIMLLRIAFIFFFFFFFYHHLLNGCWYTKTKTYCSILQWLTVSLLLLFINLCVLSEYHTCFLLCLWTSSFLHFPLFFDTLSW